MVLKTLPIELWQKILNSIPYDWAPRLHNNPDPLTAFSAHESTFVGIYGTKRTVKARTRLLTVCKAWYPIAEEILYSDLFIDSWDRMTLFQTLLAAERGDRQPLGWFTRSILVEIGGLEIWGNEEYRKEHWEEGISIDDVDDADPSPGFGKLKCIVGACPRLQAIHLDSGCQNDPEWGPEYEDWFTHMPKTVKTLSWYDCDWVPFEGFGALSPLCKQLVNLHLDFDAHNYSNNTRKHFLGAKLDFPALRRLVIRGITIYGISLEEWKAPSIEWFSVPRLYNGPHKGVEVFLSKYGKQLKCLDISDLSHPVYQLRQSNKPIEAKINSDSNSNSDPRPERPKPKLPGLFGLCPNLEILVLDLSNLSQKNEQVQIAPIYLFGLDSSQTYNLEKVILRYSQCLTKKIEGKGTGHPDLVVCGGYFSSGQFPNLKQVSIIVDPDIKPSVTFHQSMEEVGRASFPNSIVEIEMPSTEAREIEGEGEGDDDEDEDEDEDEVDASE